MAELKTELPQISVHDIVLDDFNDEGFDLEYSIEQAQLHLDEVNKKPLSNCDLESEVWEIEDSLAQSRQIIDFNEIKNAIQFYDAIPNKEEFVLVLKCWTAALTSNISAPHVREYLKVVTTFITVSNGLNPSSIKVVEKYLKHECNDIQRYITANAALNFLDYYEQADPNSSYTSFLAELKDDINLDDVIGDIRKLPPSSDVLAFSWVLEDFWQNVKVGSSEYFKYFPIYLWWLLTNLIPLRPSEFCHIERNCLLKEGNNHYIRLPRKKQKTWKRIQIIDKILIPQELYTLIEDYKSETEKFGHTVTLIHYPSIPSLPSKQKLNPYIFTRANLKHLIEAFYDNIVFQQYGYSFEQVKKKDIEKVSIPDEVDLKHTITQRIKPGDTRHFAFLNLMRQGYHPVEIARLGGHATLNAQYHYHQHTEYWVDTEILQLMLKFTMQQSFTNERQDSTVNLFVDYEFKKRCIFRPANSDVKIPVEIGYCTDPYQNCRVEDCLLCDSWRITPEEFREKSSEIEKKMQESDSEVNRLINVLKNLHRLALQQSSRDEDFSEQNPIFNKDLIMTRNELNNALQKFVKYRSIKARYGRG